MNFTAVPSASPSDAPPGSIASASAWSAVMDRVVVPHHVGRDDAGTDVPPFDAVGEPVVASLTEVVLNGQHKRAAGLLPALVRFAVCRAWRR
jgi:hypothetical protein